MLPAHRAASYPRREPHTALRITLQLIVMSVMSVICLYLKGLHMTVNCECVRGPSRHRHGERHGEIGLGKPLARYHDGDDAHDGHLQRFSRRWWRLCLPSEM